MSLPLYFSVLTETGYEADKAVLLRVLALLAGGAWLLTGRAGGRLAVNRILAGLVVALLLWYCLATVASVDPGLSFWGSAARGQGLWTWAGYTVIFAVAATRLSASRQWEMITIMVVGSVPVVVYAYLQQLGIDPVPSGGDPDTLQWPVRSTLGQHIFLGSYLVLIIPFTAVRAVSCWTAWRTAPARPDAATLLLVVVGMVVALFAFLVAGVAVHSVFAVYPLLLGVFTAAGFGVHRLMMKAGNEALGAWLFSIALVLQVLALLFTGARGAWLAAFATVPVLGILYARRTGRLRLSAGLLAASVAAAFVLILLNIPGGPLQPLRTVHALSRVSNITDSGGAGGSAQGRLLIWQGVDTLMTSTPRVGNAPGGAVRDLVGYGPESLHWAFQPVFPLRLRQVTSEIWTWDRAHNVFLDRLVDAGIVGVSLFVLLLLWGFVLAVRGALHNRRETGLIAIGTAAAIAGHVVDGVFGLETAVTLGFLWLFLGFIAARPGSDNPGGEDNGPGRWKIVAGGLCVVVVVGTVLWLGTGLPTAVVAALWLLAVTGGVGVAALAVWPAGGPGLTVPLHRVVAVGLVLAVGLAGSFTFENAAMQERAGLDSLALARYPQAISALQASVQAFPQNPGAWTELGGSILALAPRGSAQPSYVPGAGDEATLSPATMLSLGTDQLFGLGRLALEQARKLTPLDPDTYNNLGNLDLQRGNTGAALREFAQAESLSFKNPRYLDEEALAYLQAHQTVQALKTAKSALTLDTGFWFSHYTLANVYAETADSAGARTQARLALYWSHNYWPSPPPSQLAQMRSLAAGA